MGTINVKNVVTDYGVNNNYGGNPSTNTSQIQLAMNNAETDGGGIVYFPAGRYLINGTLKIPNKVKLLGFGGTTFGYAIKDITGDPSQFLTLPATVIKMDGGANVNMIEQKGLATPLGNNVLFQGEIENFVFWGNRENQNLGNGIYLKDITNNNYATRGHIRIRNILLYEFKEKGFYGGVGQHELYIDEVVVFRCGGDGFVVYGQDIKANRLQSAANGGTGIKIIGKYFPAGNEGLSASGSARFYDVDCWSNEVGIEVYDTINLFFFGLSSNINNTYGMYIHPGSTQNSYSPQQIQVFRGTFDGNEVCDIKVSSIANNVGPSDLVFDSCLFRGGDGIIYPKPNYAIIDDSYLPARNIIKNCFFNKNNYTYGIINNIGIYAFRDCYDFGTRKVLDELNVPYTYINGNYTLLPTDGFITVGTSTGNRGLTLPKLTSTQVGKIFYISKSDSHPYSVNLIPFIGDTIQGTVSINQIYKTIMVINAGANWYSILIA